MIWALVACAAAACAHTGAHAQPLTCTTDDQCENGFYCDRDVAYTCRRCLNCEQLKRDPPLAPSHCIKSVAECGSCITGLVEDLRGDVSLECVHPDARSDDAAIPAYAWVIISIVALLLFALVVFIVTYVLRNTYTFKILASTRASVQSPRGAGAAVSGVASAPDLPPPYNAHYSAVRPTSPPPPHSPDNTHDDAHSHGEESSWPFIKRTPSIQAASHGGARESAGSQAARVFSNPHYVRGPQLPPSYDGAGVVTLPASDDERDALAHDEDTMESTWTPSDDHHDNNDAAGGAAGGLSAQLEAARGSALVRAPHHQPCGWQESNNRSAGEAEGGAAGSSSAPAFVINVVQTIHTQAPPRHAQQP